MDTIPDAILLRRYADAGDEAAFGELVRRYLSLVYHAALRQTNGDAHAAKDIVQTVFTLVARKAHSLAHHQTLAGWLHTTTRFAAGRHQRTERRRLRREQEAHTMHEIAATETTSVSWEHMRSLIDDVLADLNAADREAVLFRFFAGLSLAEVGAKLNVSENAARMRVDRALEKLHALLARRGVASTATALGAALAGEAMAAVPAGLAASVTSAALAGAPVGASALTGFFLMKAKTAVFALVVLVAAGSAIFEFNRARQATAAFASATLDRDGLRAEVRAALQRAARAERDLANVRSDIEAGRAATPHDESPLTPPPAKPEKVKPGISRSLDVRYGSLYRELGFDATQSAQLKALLLESVRRNDELLKAAPEAVGRVDAALVRAINARARAELLTNVRATFGENVAQALERYDAIFPLRGPVDELAKSLVYTDTPLTAAQAEQLIAAVANNARDGQGRIDFEPLVQPDFYRMMLAASAGTLSAPQVEALRQLLGPDREPRGAAPKKAPPAPKETTPR